MYLATIASEFIIIRLLTVSCHINLASVKLQQMKLFYLLISSPIIQHQACALNIEKPKIIRISVWHSGNKAKQTIIVLFSSLSLYSIYKNRDSQIWPCQDHWLWMQCLLQGSQYTFIHQPIPHVLYKASVYVNAQG